MSETRPIENLRQALSDIPTLTLGGLIRERRERRGISAPELAGAIGCSINDMIEIEADRQMPTEQQFDRLSTQISLARHTLVEIAAGRPRPLH